jgi:ubiquinone/menaquinone biosynthesis C-methylase UbiE
MAQRLPIAQRLPFVQKRFTKAELRLLQVFYGIVDRLHPYVHTRASLFDVKPGHTVIDYGCGPGRYSLEFAELVGKEGMLIAVDLLEAALQETHKKLAAAGHGNFELVLADGYHTGIASNIADAVFAIDMFQHVPDSMAFLREVHRILQPQGLLYVSGVLMPRTRLNNKIDQSGMWEVAIEHKKFIAYRPRTGSKI